MSTLSPLLDVSFLTALARQLRSARDRLTLRTAGNLPSIPELIVALRLYIARCDRDRLENPTHQSPPASPLPNNTSNTPDIVQLAYYLALADAAYYQTEDDLKASLSAIGVPMPLEKNAMAGKWAPGYLIVRDRRYDSLVLVVRGSKELSDLVTNLSADAEPFLTGTGHQGMVKSAHHLHQRLRITLGRYLTRYKPTNGLVIVGHSLGGAVASAVTMLLRSVQLDREFEEENEGAYTRSAFRQARCFAYCAPPCLSRELAAQSEGMGITTVVAGYDIVPRLSAASLDRFLERVSRYNWGRDMGDSFGQAVGSVARGWVGEQSAAAMTRAVSEHGATGVSLVGAGAARSAQAALDRAGAGGSRSALWSLALNATVFVGSLVSEGLAGNHRRSLVNERRRPDYSFARHFGMDEADVERVLGEDLPQEVYLAGCIYHLERPFSVPEQQAAVDGRVAEQQAWRIVKRECEYFTEVEASVWMVHDHHRDVVLSALEDIGLVLSDVMRSRKSTA
eukprot:GFKZ01005937.1.p1 GENE.GFKZ01005937.1~~GFKZ01005937.1.p1  ORF type:complete len:522 (+),score=44.08 GFKZ01005937.1:44-1567(+)